MAELSPAARAVLYDYGHEVGGVAAITSYERRGIAAALRAAADQVVPDGPKPSADLDYHLMNWTKSLDQYYQRQQTRDELLAIAAELEGANG